jgi:hypothetical protein
VFEDKSPVAYEMSGKDTAGVHALPPYVVYRNPNALPRVFVVFDASGLPERSRVLAALRETDFRRHVILENFTVADKRQPTNAEAQRTATITTYEPNRVVVQVGDGDPGWLVLTDVWYPGWSCTINGEAVPIHRADFLFRAVTVPAGAQEVVFTFALPLYDLGKRISGLALAAVLALGVCSLVWPRLRGVPSRVTSS